MWLRVIAVVVAVTLTAGAGYVVFTTPTSVPTPPVATTTPPAPAPTERVATAPTAPPSPQPTVTSTAAPYVPPTTQPDPAPSPVPTAIGTAEQRAAQRLERLVARTKLGGAVGVAVIDDRGQEVYGAQAHTPLLPASTQKLTVAAAALVQFGPDHRFTTTVSTTAPPDDRGVVDGDLVIVGGGDPALASPAFTRIEPDRPHTRVGRLARQIRKAGVRRVTGRVLADPSILAHEPVATGWPLRYFDSLDATRISGLTVDGGRRVFRSGSSLRSEAASEPSRQAAVVLRDVLRAQGVKVRGGARAVGAAPSGTQQIASVSSPPLDRLLRYMVQRSDNHLADTIFRMIGAANGSPTWIGAAGATARALAPLQLDWSDVVLADGSGLSRANRVSPRFLAQLQSRLWRSNLHSQWVDLLAVTGVRGTLKTRLRSSVAQGRVYGKTGSLRDVSSLVGTVVGTDGRTLHFAVVGNRLSSTTTVRTFTDRAVLVMAEELQDCRRVREPVPRKKRNKGKPKFEVRLVCG